jgi:Protein of unknown function (DUF3107)
MATAERVELEVGYESGGFLRCQVAPGAAAELVGAFARDPDGLVSLDSDKGRVVVDLRRVAYVRELGSRRQVGFGA